MAQRKANKTASFASVSMRSAFLARVGRGRSVAKFRPGNRVFAQGDAANAVFYIQEGRVKLTVVSRQGKEAIIAILGAGDFFGEGLSGGTSGAHGQRRGDVGMLPSCGWRRRR